MSDLIQAHLMITGKVQGVFYRMETQKAARKIGVTGWVRNLPDGRVEAVIEGEQVRVQQAIDWCQEGPPSAHVDKVEVNWLEASGQFKDMTIRY